MPPETTTTPDTPQPVPESLSPIVEDSVPATEPATPPQEASPGTTVPEAPPAPTEEAPVPETDQPATPTAQIPPNEPIPAESDPIPSAPAPEPPSAAAPVPTGILHTARDLLNKARISIQDRKRKKRDKIMAALNTKNKITNDEVEKLLHVSDATATRYLSALMKEGKIRQVGKTGTAVSYTKV